MRLDRRARRAARRVGLEARKWRGRLNTVDNFGDYMIVDPYTNSVVAGERFELTAEDAIDFCKDT
jgi:hypothetical protein